MPALEDSNREDFAQALASGLSQRKAYKKAYPNFTGTDRTADNKGYILAHDNEIRARYEELKNEAAFSAGGAVLTRNEKRKILAKLARDESLPVSDRQRAIDLDNKMENEYTNNVNLSGTVMTGSPELMEILEQLKAPPIEEEGPRDE